MRASRHAHRTATTLRLAVQVATALATCVGAGYVGWLL